jgi:tripartite-type tricarboxylate transporter receptor subunit TctC
MISKFTSVAASAALAFTVIALAPLEGSAQEAKDPLFKQCTYIRMIVPYAAGGAGDIGARMLAPFMTEDLGISVQIENVPGAGSQIGVTALAKSKPNGCTIGWTHLPATIATYLDPTRQAVFNRQSLTPFAMYVIDPGGIAVKGDSPFNSLEDLLKAAKERPGKISISDSGVLSDGHLLLLELQRQTGAQFAIVHSGGGAEGTADLLGGHVGAQTVNLSGPQAAMVASGQMKILATFTKDPQPDYPGVKTAEQQGYKIYSSTSRALSVPTGTPQAVIDRLSQSVSKAVALPAFQSKAATAALTVTYMNAKDAGAYWDETEKTFGPLIADAVAKK